MQETTELDNNKNLTSESKFGSSNYFLISVIVLSILWILFIKFESLFWQIETEEKDDVDPKQLSKIYSHVRKLISNDMLLVLDDEMAETSIRDTETDILLAWLTASMPVKTQLPSRSRFFQDTKCILKKRGQLKGGILDGLK